MTLLLSSTVFEVQTQLTVRHNKSIISHVAGPGMIKKLQYRFSRTKIDPGAIEDVYDGELYKKHSCPGGFLLINTTYPSWVIQMVLLLYGPMVMEFGYGVWPLVNEIPPSERCVYLFLIFLNPLKKVFAIT